MFRWRMVLVLAGLTLIVGTPAEAACTVTYTISNGTTADASKVMQDFNDILSCAAPTASPHFTGSVGIGTSIPAQTLHVYDNSSVAQLRLEGPVNNGSGIILVNAATVYNWYVGSQNHVGNGLEITPSTSAGGTTFTSPAIVVLQNGNVGVGTTSPGRKLDVNGDINVGTNLVVGTAIYSNRFYGASTDIFFKNSTATKTYLYLVDATGNVGIGTTNPQARAVISNGGAEGIELMPASGGGIDAIQFYNRSGASYDMARFIAGSYRWDIAGTQKAALDSSGNFSVASLVSCGGVTTNGSGVMSCTSDARLKDVHGRFTAGLSELLGIEPASYSWKSGTPLYDGGVMYHGFIAQNIRMSLPQAVSTGPDNYLRVNQLTILAASVNAIKELKALNDRQAAEVARLKRQFSDATATLAGAVGSVKQLMALSDRQAAEIALLKKTNASSAIFARQLEQRIGAIERRSRMRTARN